MDFMQGMRGNSAVLHFMQAIMMICHRFFLKQICFFLKQWFVKMEPVLPVVTQVAYVGWRSWRELEDDIWIEELALRRPGWSETHWRRWLQILDLEAKVRTEFLELSEKRYVMRWGGITGGRTEVERAVWEAMIREEKVRRFTWNWDMRMKGWGEAPGPWLTKHRQRLLVGEPDLTEQIEMCLQELEFFGPE